MILRLAAEQARSQRRFTIWTAALMTLALTLSSVALFGYATQRVADKMSETASFGNRENNITVMAMFDSVPEDVVASTLWDERHAPTFMPVTEVDALLASAINAGSDVVARRGTSARIAHDDSASPFVLTATTGTFDWTLVIAEGAAPGPGEIALCASLASTLGVQVGDRVSVETDPSAQQPTAFARRTFTVSGLVYTCSWNGNYETWCPEAYVAWEESSDPSGLFAENIGLGSGTTMFSGVGATGISWNVGAPSLAALTTIEKFNFAPGIVIPTMAYRAGIFAGLLLIGIVIMAFAVGRAQAQAHLQWVATARTLGATKGAVATATIVETLVMGVTSCVVALGLGYGIAELDFMTTRPAVPLPFGPSSIATPWWTFTIVATTALALASIIAVAPAFWAARVPPVAALKPVAEATESEASRRVSLVWILFPFTIGVASLGLLVGVDPKPLLGIFLSAAVAALTGIVILKEALRGVVERLGRWLAARHAPWAMATGDAFTARPRQAVAPAVLFALPVGVYTWALTLTHFLTVDNAAANFNEGWSVSRRAYLVSIWADAEVLRWVTVILAVFALVSLAIALAGRGVTMTEEATRRALGLSSADARRASFVQYALPPVIGAAAGVVVGETVGILTHFLTPLNWPGVHEGTLGEYFHALLQCGFDSAVLILLAGVIAATLGFVLAATTRRAAPVEVTRPTTKVGVR